MRFAGRLRKASYRRKIDVFTMIFGDFVAPQHLHRGDVVLDLAPSMIEVAAENRRFLAIPTRPYAEQESPAATIVERGHLLGGQNRIALRNQGDAGAKFDAAGSCSRARQGQQ